MLISRISAEGVCSIVQRGYEPGNKLLVDERVPSLDLGEGWTKRTDILGTITLTIAITHSTNRINENHYNPSINL